VDFLLYHKAAIVKKMAVKTQDEARRSFGFVAARALPAVAQVSLLGAFEAELLHHRDRAAIPSN
jgi:hypothetical protein